MIYRKSRNYGGMLAYQNSAVPKNGFHEFNKEVQRLGQNFKGLPNISVNSCI